MHYIVSNVMDLFLVLMCLLLGTLYYDILKGKMNVVGMMILWGMMILVGLLNYDFLLGTFNRDILKGKSYIIICTRLHYSLSLISMGSKKSYNILFDCLKLIFK